MTLTQASELTGIEQARFASIERGVVEPSGDEVLIIADVYGEPVEFFITNERSASIEKSSDLYRMYDSTFSSADRRNIQEFLTLCRMEHEIETLLGSRPGKFDFHPGRGHRHKKTHGRQVAEKLRADLGLGVEHIRREHQKSGGQMSQIYIQAHYEACEKRLARQMGPTEAGRE